VRKYHGFISNRGIFDYSCVSPASELATEEELGDLKIVLSCDFNRKPTSENGDVYCDRYYQGGILEVVAN